MKKLIIITIIALMVAVPMIQSNIVAQHRESLQFTKLTAVSPDEGDGSFAIIRTIHGDEYGSVEIIY